MSIATELSRLNTNKEALATAKTAIASAITTKGGTVASWDGFEGFAADIASIPSGGEDYGSKYITHLSGAFNNVNFTNDPNPVFNFPNFGNTSNNNYWRADNAFSWTTGLKSITLTLGYYNHYSNISSMFEKCSPSTLKTITVHGKLLGQNTRSAFGLCSELETISFDEIDFSNNGSDADLNNIFNGCSSLVNVSGFKKDTLKFNISVSSSPNLSDDSLIMFGNFLSGSATGKTITMHSVSKNRIGNIIGNVIDGSFVGDVSGTTNLQDFITTVKGWTIA